ncbi:MAG: PadR family transcriptional regulator [Candidatus Bathyarchaeota archaeon]|nr:PadR family transcriptional regulator [Candidatus Bathyarchaeota archaeon]
MSKQTNEFLQDFSRFYILLILFESPCHGYGIMSKFRKRIGKDISPSLVYPFLKQLENEKLVKHKCKPLGAKERKVFELTDEGKELCETLFKRFSNLVSSVIAPTLSVCANCGCKVFEGGHREKIRGREMAFCCVHCAQSYKENHKAK